MWYIETEFMGAGRFLRSSHLNHCHGYKWQETIHISPLRKEEACGVQGLLEQSVSTISQSWTGSKTAEFHLKDDFNV